MLRYTPSTQRILYVNKEYMAVKVHSGRGYIMSDKERLMKITHAKFNCDMTLFSIPELTKVMDSVKKTLLNINGNVFEINGVDWVFIENDVCTVDNTNIISGRLGRSLIQRSLDLDKNKQKFVEIDTPGWIYSNYILNIASEEMVIEERHPYITFNLFTTAFISILNSQIENLGDAYINPRLNTKSIWEEIESLKILKRAEFNLRLPNFNHNPEFSQILDEMKTIRAKKATRIYENNFQGLNAESEFLRAGIEMSASTYGSFELEGEKHNNEQTVIKSNNKTRKTTIGPIEDSPAKFAADFYRFLNGGGDNES